MIGHSLEEHQGVMVSVDCDYPCPKVHAKVVNSQNKKKCLFLNGRVTFVMVVQLLAVEAD